MSRRKDEYDYEDKRTFIDFISNEEDTDCDDEYIEAVEEEEKFDDIEGISHVLYKLRHYSESQGLPLCQNLNLCNFSRFLLVG